MRLNFEKLKKQIETKNRGDILKILYYGINVCYHYQGCEDCIDSMSCPISYHEKIVPLRNSSYYLLVGAGITPKESREIEIKKDKTLFWAIMTTIRDKKQPISNNIPFRMGNFNINSYEMIDEELEEIQNEILKALERN